MTTKRIRYPVILFVLLMFGEPCAHATTFPTGTVKNVRLYNGPNGPGSCPTGFASGTPGTITCYSATVSCSKVADIGVSWSVIDPMSSPKGTIVLHGGFNGMYAFGSGFPYSYISRDFQTVQVVWGSSWENVGAGYTHNIKLAACRPATFFRYIDNNYAAREGIAMCLQGYSAGAAAIAYSLKDYGAGSYVDKAMMLAGPPLSDLEHACEVPNAPPVQVWPPGQFGMVYSSSALLVQGHRPSSHSG